MRKSWFAALWIGSLMLGVLLISSHAIAAPSSQSGGASPLRSPALPAGRLGVLSPYSVMGAGIDGTGANASELLADADVLEELEILPRGTITERLTTLAQGVDETSPYYRSTWLTYYGRPGIPIMGILGEHEVDDLVDVLKKQARDYEYANSRELSVLPAFHLVYGMATKATGEDGSHLAYIEDDVVMQYIEKAEEEGWSVILDVQIGALSPVEAISLALPYLAYENVHLAIDPEFAMVHPGQYWPGDPIGYVTGEQVNEVQSAIQRYMRRNRIEGQRVLLVHQFQSNMIVEPETIDTGYDQVALTISVDGWGGPWAKITKYNSFITQESPFAAFKLFYQWDEPILTPAQALGEEGFDAELIINVTPNMIIYQ